MKKEGERAFSIPKSSLQYALPITDCVPPASMSDPILPAPVPSRYHANNSNSATPPTTFSWDAARQAQVVSGPGESDEKRLSVTGSGIGGDVDGVDCVDVPYEYPKTYPPRFPVGSYLSYVKRVAENSPVSEERIITKIKKIKK